MNNEFKILEHPEYGYAHLSPLPSIEEVEKYYKEEFYSSNYQQCNDSAQEKQKEDRFFLKGRFDDIFATLQDHWDSLEGKSLFDIGCGYGELLMYAKEQGLTVAGLEVAPEAVATLQESGLNIVLSDIEGDLSAATEGKRYSIVTLLNVLEHLREPAKILRDIREHVLEKDGILIVDVPNEFNPMQLAACEIHALPQWWIAAPVHINYFTPESLKKLMQACGYEIVDMQASFPLEMFLLMGDMYVGNAELGAQCHKKRVMFEANMRKTGKTKELRELYRALAKGGFGRQIVCYGKIKDVN